LQPSGRTSTLRRLSLRPGRSRERSSRPFARFLGRRLVALVLLAIGITFVAFCLTHIVPGDPAAANLGQQAINDPAAVAAFNHHYGLDRPLPTQYAIYLWRLLHGDLGESEQNHDAVTHDLGQAIPATAELAIVSILIAIAVGVSLGLVAAVRRNKLTDHILRIVSLGGVSMPTFWIALVGLYVFFFRLNWLPGTGRLDPIVVPPPHRTGLYTVDALIAGQWGTFGNALDHLILPALVLAAYNIGLLTRYTRSAVLEVISNDFVRAARAKGIPERIVVRRHVLRAALPGIVTVIGLAFANVMTGAVLVENVFSWPGIGQYAYHSATTLDLPAIMGVSLFVAVVYIVVNFLVDVLYGVVDARLRVA
jgi:peptide/nickel transport system permease protein